MVMRRLSLKLMLLSLFSLASAYADDWQPENDADRYGQAMDVAREMENYTRFFAAEKSSLTELTPGYHQMRWDFMRDLCFERKRMAHCKKEVEAFMAFCKEHELLKDDGEELKIAATALGMEFLTDRHWVKYKPEEGIREFKGLVYTEYKGSPQRLDLYLPEKPKSKAIPCIIFIHGGGWSVHKREWMSAHAKYMAAHGYAGITIDYRLVPRVTPIECVEDAKAAVRWVRANAGKYGFDPDRIGASGGSAGAHLSAMLATSSDQRNLEGDGSNLEHSSRIHAAVGYATPALTGRNTWPYSRKTAPKEILDQVSPYQFVTRDDAPMLFLHGAKDYTVRVEEARDMHEKYQKAGVHSELEILPDEGHVFYMNVATIEKTFKFFESIFE